MSTASVAKAENQPMDEQVYTSIAHFIAPSKRKALICALDKSEELQHGELAVAIDSSPTSLSNILSKFDQFDYKLLNVRTVGKYRIYALSALGKAYVTYTKEKAKRKDNGSEFFQEEDDRLLQEAEKCLKEFKVKYPEKWQMYFDNALIRRTDGKGRLLDETSENR